MSRDRDFVVGAPAGHPHVHVVPGQAHAYEFASVLGRILAELAVDGSTPSAGELGAFRIDRPALRDPGAPRTFVV
jgi:sarcosine oxidase